MPQSIDVDDDVIAVLKRDAEPFVDTPNTVLRRALGIDDGRSPHPVNGDNHVGSGRAAPGSLLPESEYEIPILRYLDGQSDGRAPSRDVIDAVGDVLADRLTEADKQLLKSRDIRWKNRAAFVRLRLVEKEELAGDTPRGTWQITAKGRKRLRSEDEAS